MSAIARDITSRKKADAELQRLNGENQRQQLREVAVAQKRAEELEHEILERKQAESALRHERDRAQRYLDTAEVILLALDLDGRITLVNRYALRPPRMDRATSCSGATGSRRACRPGCGTRSESKFHDLVGGDLSVVENPVLTRSGEERLIEWRNTRAAG